MRTSWLDTLLPALRATIAPEDAGGPVRLVLATATPGGGFPAFGAAFVEALAEVDPSLVIETLHTKGSMENLPRLEDGSVDLALVAGEPAYEALTGIGGARTSAKIAVAMYSSPGMFVVRADSPYHRIADLIGKPVAWGARGSGLVILGRYVMEGLGLDPGKDFVPHYLDQAAEGPRMVEDGRAAALWGAGIGWPGFMTVAKSAAGARFIVPSADEIGRIVARHPFLKPTPVPANSYPGQTAALVSVASWSFVMARAALPDAIAARLIRAVHHAEAGLAKRLAQARETTAANTAAAAPHPDMLHPGVRAYLREVGLLG